MDDPMVVCLPHLIVFEGVDGTGKTTLTTALTQYYQEVASTLPIYSSAFPGNIAGMLGEWVYRLHHDQHSVGPHSGDITAAALQLLHVAAHVDALVTRISGMLAAGGAVILDRTWWSTYAYARCHLPPEVAWTLIGAERPFWPPSPRPVIIYLTRQQSLKSDEVDATRHAELGAYYREVIVHEQEGPAEIFVLSNDGILSDTWKELHVVLNLPHHAMSGGAAYGQ